MNETPPPLIDPSLLRHQCLIDGVWVNTDAGEGLNVNNPSTGAILDAVPRMGANETRRAIDAAEAALAAWGARPAKERAALLRRWYELLIANQNDLAIHHDGGARQAAGRKPRRDRLRCSYLEWFAEEAKRAYGDVIPAPPTDRRIIVIKQPIGVYAAITPWNFPAAMITRKVGPALAAGCTMVIKPASQTPPRSLPSAA